MPSGPFVLALAGTEKHIQVSSLGLSCVVIAPSYVTVVVEEETGANLSVRFAGDE